MNLKNIICSFFTKKKSKTVYKKKQVTEIISSTIKNKQISKANNSIIKKEQNVLNTAYDDIEKTDFIGETNYNLYKSNLKSIPPAIILLIGHPSLVGKQWLLSGEIEILGRSSSCSITVLDPSLSKSHIKFYITSDYVVSVTDLQSTNGLIINSHKQETMKTVALKNNDQIKLGNLVFKFLEKGNPETISSSQVYQKSLIDSLTNISNKAAFESDITSRMPLKHTFSLILFDIDHFKKFNDLYGHLCGDFVLSEMSKLISGTLVRDEDFLARYGGEEFCLIVPQNIALAQEIAERLRKSIENYNFTFQGKELRVKISLGLTEKKLSDTVWMDVFNRADKALYESKSSGRNKVSLA